MAMAAAMIQQAMKDLYRKERIQINHHVDAICWLGSKASTKWFDAAKIEQSAALPKLRWSTYARNILSDGKVILSDDQRGMLIETLEYFQTKSGKA
jgi:hypothetical protein